MFIKIDDLNISYDKKGSGEEILILHGWGTSLESFRGVIDDLSMTNTVYAIDFPGFGMSDEPKTPWDVKDYASFTKKFIDAMNMKNPVLLGHSFGGRVSIVLSSQHHFDKMILAGCAGIKPARSIKYYGKVYTYKTIKHMSRVFPFNFILKDFMSLYKSKAGSSDYKAASDMMKKVFIRVINEDL
ncbi:MAG: alpha/beta hydrolase, partial [Acidaminobacteraceae bacterium]